MFFKFQIWSCVCVFGHSCI